MTLYLYAIVDAPPAKPLGIGIEGHALRSLRIGKAWVVAEEILGEASATTSQRRPLSARPSLARRSDGGAPTLASVVAHDRVVRRIARRAGQKCDLAILPLRFGSAVANRAALAKLFAPLSKEIVRALDRVRGAVQFTMRVTGRPARTPKLPRSVGPGTRWLAARMHAQRVPEIALLSEATRPFVRDTRTERHARPPLIASVYHLVPKDDVGRWRASVRRSMTKLEVEVVVTGPWPPYAFAELG